MTVVRQNGGTLNFTSEDIWGDMEIVMTVVNQVGWALELASGNLRRDW